MPLLLYCFVLSTSMHLQTSSFSCAALLVKCLSCCALSCLITAFNQPVHILIPTDIRIDLSVHLEYTSILPTFCYIATPIVPPFLHVQRSLYYLFVTSFLLSLSFLSYSFDCIQSIPFLYPLLHLFLSAFLLRKSQTLVFLCLLRSVLRRLRSFTTSIHSFLTVNMVCIENQYLPFLLHWLFSSKLLTKVSR